MRGLPAVPALLRRSSLFDAFAERLRPAAAAAAAAAASGPEVACIVAQGGTEAQHVRAAPASPIVLAKEALGPSHTASALVARVDGALWDLTRPVPAGTQRVDLLGFDAPEGRHVLWHSAAHALGLAIETVYAEHEPLLSDGPPVAVDAAAPKHFYYDALFGGHGAASLEDADKVRAVVRALQKSKAPFERLEVPVAWAREMFADNKFKLHFLERCGLETVTLYRCGSFVDLCRGPHVPNARKIGAFEMVQVSGAYWENDAAQDQLQRVYGVAFPSKAELVGWRERMDEVARRDHRAIGKAQSLFMFHPTSPGSVFMLPHGTRVYNKLVDLMRGEYHRRGYREVMTPLIYDKSLWETSGHWANYKDEMFVLKQDGAEGHLHGHEMSLKPMNCPGHCLIFDAEPRTHRQLPVRLADFSSLHRNEVSGSLAGLTRLRRFQQDDAHIFCTPEQLEAEIGGCLNFMEFVYSTVLGFEFDLFLSTRPDEAYIGELADWEHAEAVLQKILDGTGRTWTLNAGDGAFYGPKIDVQVTDALGRRHQCGTVQLDFQLPIRFGLEYQDAAGEMRRPVIIHRAIFGSIERLMALVIEHTAGKWPLWLSPRAACVLPVSEKTNDYAHAVAKELAAAGHHVDVDASGNTLQRKIRSAQLQQYNYMLVVGPQELEDGTVSVRSRDGTGKLHGSGGVTVPELLRAWDEQVAAFE